MKMTATDATGAGMAAQTRPREGLAAHLELFVREGLRDRTIGHAGRYGDTLDEEAP